MTCLSKIKELSDKLIAGFHYLNSHPNQLEENIALMDRSLPIMKELMELGVTEQACIDALTLGLPIIKEKND